MGLLVAGFWLIGNRLLAKRAIFGHRSWMRSGVFTCHWSAIFLFVLALSAGACDRSSSPSDVPPQAEEKKEPAKDTSPRVGESQSTEKGEGDVQLRPQPALEPDLPPPRFDSTAPEAFRKAFSDMQAWVRSEGGQVHAALVDLDSDRWLLRASESVPVNVASNAKIVTAAAALELLGSSFAMKTELFADLDSKGHTKRLVLRGGGAPDLSDADLWRLVRVAQGLGLEKVEDIVVDQSRFSARYVPPAYDQQPDEWAPFRANISALSINENAVELNVVSGKEGDAARIWYSPPGVVDPVGEVSTGKPGSGDRVRWSLDPKPDASYPRSQVGGSLAAGLGRRRYARRLEDPRRAGGLVLRSLLRAAGVQVSGEVALGEHQGEKRLALWTSAPLAQLVRALGKDSNNFYAEMLFAALSAARLADDEADAPWSSELGAKAVRGYLSDRGIDTTDIVIKNGSGLFDANRYSAELLVKVLAAVEDNPRVFGDFLSHLAMGGTDGTLEKRMKGEALAGRIRAKTGTLRSFIALSGYILRTQGKSPAAFSVIIKGIATKHWAVRQKLDNTVLEWARILEEEIDQSPG